MVEHEGEIYLIASFAAKHLGISRCQFYNNVKPYVQAHKVGARRWKHYKWSDLEKFRAVEKVA